MERRKFIKKAGAVSLLTSMGLDPVFGKNISENYIPVALEDQNPYTLFNKHKDMVMLNDRPWNMEAQAHILNDDVTPVDKMFIRNNGLIPMEIDESKWSLTVDGESANAEKQYSIQDLKSKFKSYTYQLILECGGNGRSEFDPPAKGNQWTIGAVSCAKWTGVRLKDLLEDVGINEDAKYIGYYGADLHLSGDISKNPISRGIPLWKALSEETLVAYAMNDEPIPKAHGFPLRLVAGGFPASASGKWINRLSVRNIIHDGTKMGGQSYRVPCESVPPGTKVSDEDMCIIESMPIKSLITYPKTGAMIDEGDSISLKGHAWAGELSVSKVDYSIDFGSTWTSCKLDAPVNRLAWQNFRAEIKFPQSGYYEIWARATDNNGTGQPMVLPGWNPKGYLNNACHRIAVKVS